MFDAGSETVVEVVEGDSLAISCYARGGYPPSQITWFHEISNDSNLQVQHIEYEQDTQSHLVSVRRTIIYTASILDHNSTISCRIVQTRLQPHSIIYTRNLIVNLAVKERRFPAPLVRTKILSGLVVFCTLSLLFCLVLVLIIVKFSGRKRRRSSSQDIPLVYRTPMVSQHYSGDVLTQIADHTKPLTHTNSSNYLLDEQDNDKSYHQDVINISVETPFTPKTTSSQSHKSNNSFRTGSVSDQSRSRSSSDCASLYSHEEANLIEKLQSTDKIDVKVHETGHGHSFATLPDKMTSHDDLLRHESTDTGLTSSTSVSQLYRRRLSIPARILINPTSYPAKSLTNLTMIHHDISPHHRCKAKGRSKRRRRRTAPAKSKSTHSVFDCEQGCFDVEDISKSQQFVFITTGPMII